MSRGASRGFTLIELFLSIGLLAVLATFAAPSLTKVVQDNRIRTNSSDLMANLTIARAEAARRGVRVTVCASTTFANAAPTCDGGGAATAWVNGYVLFADVNGNGTFDAAADTVIKVAEPLSGANLLKSYNFGTTAPTAPDKFQFRPSGGTSLPGGDTHFRLCDSRSGNFGRKIEISVTGRVVTNFATCPYP